MIAGDWFVAPPYGADPQAAFGFFSMLLTLAFAAFSLPLRSRAVIAAVTVSLLAGFLFWNGIAVFSSLTGASFRWVSPQA
jgi:hypothetical protein